MDPIIPSKVGRVLNVVLFCFLGIFIRVWYLAVIQHDQHVEEAHKPQRRASIEHMGRASIRDRFNLPLALNKVQYHAAVCYSHIRQIPAIAWEKDPSGKKVRVQVRLRHIRELACKIGQILDLQPSWIEDVIHAKAALAPHVPFVIKEDISEEEYFALRALEKDWLGLATQRSSRRFYPHGKVGCDVLGSMGAMSASDYGKFTEELAELEDYIAKREAGETPFLPKGFTTPFAVRERLLELQEKAYKIHDFVGRSGIESGFDAELRGYSGRKIYEVDVKGNYLRELPGGRPPLPGQRLLLTISAELQEYAEQLLAEAEAARIKKDSTLREPWIKGGAIVAIDPATGEVLALASHPRFDPNDFIPLRLSSRDSAQRQAVRKWLENQAQIGEIWDGRAVLEREMYGKSGYVVETLPLTWENYLESIFPPEEVLCKELQNHFTIRHAVDLQKALLSLTRYLRQRDVASLIHYLSDSSVAVADPGAQQEKKRVLALLQSAALPADKCLMADLCRLSVRQEMVSASLLESVGTMSLGQLFLQRQSFLSLEEEVRRKTEALFLAHHFERWREKHFKTFLKGKRKEEKENGRYARPYTDYLNQISKQGFSEFWSHFRLPLMQSLLRGEMLIPTDQLGSAAIYWQELKALYDKLSLENGKIAALAKTVGGLPVKLAAAFLRLLLSFNELDQPLWGHYPRLRQENGMQLQRHLAAAFYPLEGFGYGRSQAFRQATPAGSVFKIVIAYQALLEKYQECLKVHRYYSDLNPLTLTDYSPQKGYGESGALFGRTSEGKPITRLYKGGRLPRSSHAGIGQVDLFGALEQSSNIYFSILAAEEIQSPDELLKTAKMFGYGERSGIELPGEIAGNLPDDLGRDKTSLYAFAIGQHTLIVTPLQTAMMLAAIAGDGQLLKPSIVQVKAGKQRVVEEEEVFYERDFAYAQEFAAIGVHFPLFTALAAPTQQLAFSYAPIEVHRSIFLPKEIREMLLGGMRRVVRGSRGTARPSLVRPVCSSPAVYQDYLLYSNQIAGKTGTAEILYKHTLDRATKAVLKKHTSFAAASFPSKPLGDAIDWDHPEVIVVVYLRFAAAGREAAPLAVQMIKKWREIRAKYGAASHVQSP